MHHHQQHYIFTELDLAPVIEIAMHSEAGPRWSRADAEIAAELYRTFLWLCWLYPKEQLVPNTVIDQFWHLHILDTKRYARDCQKIFGRLLHHNPYYGLHDHAVMQDGYKHTLDLVQRHFPELMA